MTRKNMANKIRINLNDLGVTYYSEDDLIDSIQDAYDEITVYCECIDQEIDINFQNDLTYYNLTELVPDFYRVIRVWHPGINQFMYIGSDRDENSMRNDWELTQATPRDVIISGPNMLGFVGRNSNATGFFTLFYKAKGKNPLNDNDVFQINTNYLMLIENYCTADLLEQNQEFVKAQKYWEHYEPKLQEYRQKIQLLARSDRVFTRESRGNC